MLFLETYERRDAADRNEMALAALQHCRVLRASADVISAKFYWESWDRLVLLTERSELHMDGKPKAEEAKSSSGLANLAKRTEYRMMADAGVGQQAYEVADRPVGT